MQPAQPPKFSFPKMEVEMMEQWKQNQIYEKALKLTEHFPEYVNYDGPPFATGLPHYGHILAGTIKDVVLRWARQTGHSVRPRFGWDCHGLPIEFEIEKQLGLKTRDDVLKYGVARYNEACRGIVMRYATEWRQFVERVGRWVDMDNDWKTMDLPFMESVWWVFAELYKKGLVYKGQKVLPFSTGCGTALSNFEAALNYKEVSDPSVTLCFPLVTDPTYSFLVWTTTPWTIPSNVALCVNPDLVYVRFVDTHSGKKYIAAQARLRHVYPKWDGTQESAPFTVEAEVKGAELAGLEYVPMFDFFLDHKQYGAFRVLVDGYVSADSGTGIVHQAPGFGEDDYRVCTKAGICHKARPVVCPIDSAGRFTDEVADWKGMDFKQADAPICLAMKAKGRLFRKDAEVHSYPYCWRSETPLMYKCVSCWFVEVEKIKPTVIQCAKDGARWVPEFVQTKRFANWLADAKDWCVSRSRFWGTPLPVWESADGEEVVVITSVAELEALTGRKFTDIHRHHLDDVTIPSKTPGNPPLRRVDEVFDCWFESGSMPYAHRHYPFENKEQFEQTFPADFIAEGLDQTRGWFYTLVVLGAALFEKCPFRNLICNGLVLAEDGKKMSKRLQNYPDPLLVMDKHGADALRLYLIGSPAVRAEPLNFNEKGLEGLVKTVFLPIWNSLTFLEQALELKGEKKRHWPQVHPHAGMDHWMLAAFSSLVSAVREDMDKYFLFAAVGRLKGFVTQLSNWYIRMNRDRLKGELGEEEREQSLATLYTVLVGLSQLLAPFTPFVADAMFQRLRALSADAMAESVHHTQIPVADQAARDPVALRQVERMQVVVELCRTLRERLKIPLKTPVREVIIVAPDEEYAADMEAMNHHIQVELNCLTVTATADSGRFVSSRVGPDLGAIGKAWGKTSDPIKAYVKGLSQEELVGIIRSAEPHVVPNTDPPAALTKEHLKVERTFRPDVEAHWDKIDTDPEVLVLLDKRVDDELLAQGFLRDVSNRVQKMRKKCGLSPSQLVDAWYEGFEAVLGPQEERISQAIRRPFRPLRHMPESAEHVFTEKHALPGGELTIVLTAVKA